MDVKEIKETDIWTLYNKNVDYARKRGFFTDIDRNNNFYNGNQWEGLLIEGIEPVQYNFIKPIINYKTSKITESLRAINYGAENVENTEFRHVAKKTCDLLNQRASRVWEKDQMDLKFKKVVKQAAVNSEGIIYVSYDKENNDPVNEIINKVDIFYGNENDSDIQNQPYILVKQRMSVLKAREIATAYGVKEKEIEYIKGDKETSDEAGETAKDEVDEMVTVLTKFYKTEGTVWFAKATKYCNIKEDTDMGTKLYPIAHALWEDVEGSARGQSEVKYLIPNQIETNKTAMRRLLTVKNTAYPQKIYNKDKIENPEAIYTVGGVIEAKGMNVDDVNKVFATTNPAQIGPDAERIQTELISTTRELANASDTATGQVNPAEASGRAILAVQQASQQPLNDQNTSFNIFLEDLARIWFDMWQTYNADGMSFEDITTDVQTGEDTVEIVDVPASVLELLRVSAKIDITPKGAYDKYAQEISLENLAKTEFFMNTSWLEDYNSLLDTDSTMPKMKIEELIRRRKEAQKRIREIQLQATEIQNKAQSLIDNGDIIPSAVKQQMKGQPAQMRMPQDEQMGGGQEYDPNEQGDIEPEDMMEE